MDVLQQQIAAMAEEINLLKSEVVQTKAAHASLHQSAVDRNTDIIRRFGEITDRLHNLSTDAANATEGKGSKKKFLIEPKQVNVAEFAGAVNDSRSKFLQWAEKVKDRAMLFDDALVEAMEKAEASTTPITD